MKFVPSPIRILPTSAASAILNPVEALTEPVAIMLAMIVSEPSTHS